MLHLAGLETSPFSNLSFNSVGCGIYAPGDHGKTLSSYCAALGYEPMLDLPDHLTPRDVFLGLRVPPLAHAVRGAFDGVARRMAPAKTEKWNALFTALLTTVYSEFRDFTCGRLYLESEGHWLKLPEPSSFDQQASAQMLRAELRLFEDYPYAPFLSRENTRKLGILIRTHLEPFARHGRGPEGPRP